MTKEYHITFACDTEQEGAKSNILRIQRLMKNGGAELISKNTEWEGVTELSFNFVGLLSNLKKITDSALQDVVNSPAYVSLHVSEHSPKVVINTKDLDSKASIQEFISKSEIGSGLLTNEIKEGFIVDFVTSKDAREFQTSITNYLAKQNHSQNNVEIFPEWVDVSVLDGNNRPSNKKSVKPN